MWAQLSHQAEVVSYALGGLDAECGVRNLAGAVVKPAVGESERERERERDRESERERKRGKNLSESRRRKEARENEKAVFFSE